MRFNGSWRRRGGTFGLALALALSTVGVLVSGPAFGQGASASSTTSAKNVQQEQADVAKFEADVSHRKHDFAALPPEVNSMTMYAGAGSGPLIAAAEAWDGLAQELGAAASAYSSVTAGLTSGPWSGPASSASVADGIPYVSWMETTAKQAEQAAGQARAQADAFEHSAEAAAANG